MVLNVLEPLKKTIKINPVKIDNLVFVLHYKWTMNILLLSALLVTLVQFFGKPIECIKSHAIDQDLLQTFCWIQSTFTLPDSFNKTVGVDVPAPGIDKYQEGENRKYHRYYQWVWIVLFLQGVSFYLPRFFWKYWEEKRLESLVVSLNLPVLKEKERKEQIKLLVSYLRSYFNHHNSYFFEYVFCETLNFINVMLHIFIVNWFLDGIFLSYGTEVLKYSEVDFENRTDPMIIAFPRMTKCTFWHYGPSGDVQRHDHLCLLPLNIINEKIYIFLWFWFIIVAAASGLILLYRAVTIFVPQVRTWVLKRRATVTPKYNIDTVMEMAKIGDWWLLYLLAKNLDSYNFAQTIHDFCRALQETDGISLLQTLPRKNDQNEDDEMKFVVKT